MNYLQLRTAVLEALIDTPAIVQAAVPRLVNQAISELEGRFNFNVMRGFASYTTTVGLRTPTPETLPEDFKEYRGKAYYEEDLGGSREIHIVDKSSILLRRWSADDTGAPRHMIIGENSGNLSVWPIPDGASDYSDGEYRIKIPYWKLLPDLVNDTDENWFTLNATQYIINWATAEGFAIDWDEKRSDWWAQRAEKEALRVILQGKKQIYSQSETLIPHQGVLEAQTER